MGVTANVTVVEGATNDLNKEYVMTGLSWQ